MLPVATVKSSTGDRCRDPAAEEAPPEGLTAAEEEEGEEEEEEEEAPLTTAEEQDEAQEPLRSIVWCGEEAADWWSILRWRRSLSCFSVRISF